MMFPVSLRFLVFLQCATIASAGILSGCASTEKRHTLSGKERAAMLAEVAAGSLNEGDPTGALATLLEAEQYDPKSSYIQHLKGLAYFYKNDSETATVCVRKAVELDPSYTDANNTLGKLLLDSGAYSEAQKYLEKAVKDPLYRDSYKPQTNLGVLHYKRGELAQAEIHLNKAILDFAQGACVAYYYRGQIRLTHSNFKEAIDDFDKATKKYCGGFEDAHFAIGLAYQRSKQFEKARRKFVEIQKTFPDTDVAKKAMDQLRYLP